MPHAKQLTIQTRGQASTSSLARSATSSPPIPPSASAPSSSATPRPASSSRKTPTQRQLRPRSLAQPPRPRTRRFHTHTAEGPDDMPATFTLTATSITILIMAADSPRHLAGIYLWEHRTARTRAASRWWLSRFDEPRPEGSGLPHASAADASRWHGRPLRRLCGTQNDHPPAEERAAQRTDGASPATPLLGRRSFPAGDNILSRTRQNPNKPFAPPGPQRTMPACKQNPIKLTPDLLDTPQSLLQDGHPPRHRRPDAVLHGRPARTHRAP